ncbi:helix-turn-helix domain-containing protein [Nocardia sp. NPDC057227]|uniref:helix-turn-helix domain-containing protein n=1 Tax=Nocardia sp. NPDC057227 TaxID=3346056 RepID=UPI00363FD3D7
MDQTASTLPRRQLGRYLREWRSRVGLTQAAAARLVEMSASALQRIEAGETTRIRPRDVEALCDVYGVPEEVTTAFVGLARQGNAKSWFHQYGDLIPPGFNVYVGLESVATHLFSYQPELIPGMLQTPQYVQSLLRAARPDLTPDEREQRVEFRIHRQSIINRRTQPVQLDVVVGETALRRPAGTPGVMAKQLRHLADVPGRLPNVSVRVLPFDAGFPGGVSMPPFVILGFGDAAPGEPVEPPVVYLEAVVGNMYLEKPEDTAKYHEAYDRIRHAALDETASRQLLRQVMREFERGA